MAEHLQPLQALATVARILGDLGDGEPLPSSVELGPLLQVIHPADLADLVTAAPDHVRVSLFLTVPDDEAQAEVLATVDASIQEELLDALPVSRQAELIQELSHDDAADVLTGMEDDAQAEVLAQIPAEEADDLRELAQYPSESAGGLMNDDFVALGPEASVRAALMQIKTAEEDLEELPVVFVVGEDGVLLGTVPLEDLLKAKLPQRIGEIMQADPVRASVDEDQELVAQRAAHYRLALIPVVDASDRLLGVVAADDLMEVQADEAAEDMYRLAGTLEKNPVRENLFERLAQRFPFLLVTIVGTYIVALVIEHMMTGELDGETNRHIGILRFIPMIAALAGNAGLQASTTMIRGFATGEIRHSDFRAILSREMNLGFLTGIAAFVVEFALLVPMEDAPLYWLVPLAQALSVVLATLFGTVIPFFCDVFEWKVRGRVLKIDPALAAGPFITTLNDVASTAIALALASAFTSALVGAGG